MRDPERAFAICRASRSQEACATAAAYCRAAGDAKRALEFLALARRGAEAFALARETGHVETLALFLGDDGVPEDYGSWRAPSNTTGASRKPRTRTDAPGAWSTPCGAT